MAIIKCKMCGGDLNVQEGITTAECEYCGSLQTVPTADNEKKLNLFARANRLRADCEFDKAAGVYENIVAEFPQEAEGYWGLVLCKYGIEYVDDPGTGKKVPTCHRSSFGSVLDDTDLEQALENADVTARKVYREEAKQIEELRKSIIAVSANEQPYDIFICYKETGSDGQRTLDSVLAQDLYDALTARDYRVFFSRISLEDKLGVEYEPYIFAALNSAKIMLAVGTDYEHYHAVWVKNEWSRYLKLMASDKNRHLIPCYKGIDPYDLPREFAKLQAQDLGKVGAVQDLLRGVEKLLPKKVQKPAEQVVVQQGTAPGVSSLLRRGQLFVGDGDWKSANVYFDKVLDIEPECAEAYLGKLMVNVKVSHKDELRNLQQSFEGNPNYQKAVAFGDDAMRKFLAETLQTVRATRERLDQEYAQEQQRLAEERAEKARLAAEAKEREQQQKLAQAKATKKCRRHNGWLIALLWVTNVLLILGMLIAVVPALNQDEVFVFQEAYYNGTVTSMMDVDSSQTVDDVWTPLVAVEIAVTAYGIIVVIFSAIALKNKTFGNRASKVFTVVTIVIGGISVLGISAAFASGIAYYDVVGVFLSIPKNISNIGKSGYAVFGCTVSYLLTMFRLLLTMALPFFGKKYRAPK